MYSRERLRTWLEPERPLLRICLWPFSHLALLLQAFAEEPGTSVLNAEDLKSALLKAGQKPHPKPFLEILEAGSVRTRSVRTLVLSDSSRVDGELLDEVARHMPLGTRLVLPVERLEDWGNLPMTTVPPQRACLSLEEVERDFEDSHAAGVAFDLTEGWVGPTELLARRGGDPEHFPEILDGPELAQKMEELVLSNLSRPELCALEDLALAGPVDPEDWRQMVVDDPERLGAFEQIFRRRLWLVPEGRGWRLPRILSRYLQNRSALAPSRREGQRGAEIRRELDIARASRVDRLLMEQGPEGSPPQRQERSSRRAHVETLSDPEAHGQTSFKLELLGIPRMLRCFSGGGQEEVSWRLRRSFRCVAYLALAAEHARSKSAMIEDLWRDEPAEAAERNFHPTLSDARRALGSSDAIVYLQGTYRLGSSLRLSVDISELKKRWDDACRLLEQGSPGSKELQERALEHLQAGWSLYRGPLMEELEDAWVQEPREELRRLYVGLLRRLAGLAQDLDRTPLALDALRSLLITEPFDEDAHIEVMNIYGRSGRRDLVRRQFVHLQEQLKELRVEPSREAVSAYNRWMG